MRLLAMSELLADRGRSTKRRLSSKEDFRGSTEKIFFDQFVQCEVWILNPQHAATLLFYPKRKEQFCSMRSLGDLIYDLRCSSGSIWLNITSANSLESKLSQYLIRYCIIMQPIDSLTHCAQFTLERRLLRDRFNAYWWTLFLLSLFSGIVYNLQQSWRMFGEMENDL